MEALLTNKNNIFEIKEKVISLNKSVFSHHSINGTNIIDNNTISIVMTSSNRSKQVLFTLKTIASSKMKNVQVVIVDDSDKDPLTIDLLTNKGLPFYIDFIKIKRENKNWHNPVVNYNIGFQYIKGGKVIIQNAEVCHIGDVLQLVNYSCGDNKYYVFDVKSSKGYEANEEIYKSDVSTVEIYNKDLYNLWYQSESNNNNYHFLTAMLRNTFNKIKEFSYDCTFGSAYDDNDFLLKIISKNITVVNMFHNNCLVGGLHLFHGNSANWDSMVESNKLLFDKKKHVYDRTGDYIDVSEKIEDFDVKYNLLNGDVNNDEDKIEPFNSRETVTYSNIHFTQYNKPQTINSKDPHEKNKIRIQDDENKYESRLNENKNIVLMVGSMCSALLIIFAIINASK